MNSHFLKKWATLEYIHTKNSRYCSNNIPTWHMETFRAMELGSTYKYFWTHIVVKSMLMPPNNSNRHTRSLRGCHWTSVDHIKVKGRPKGIYVPFLWWALVVKFFMFASTLIKCFQLKWSFHINGGSSIDKAKWDVHSHIMPSNGGGTSFVTNYFLASPT